MQITQIIEINNSLPVVYEAFRNVLQWKEILPDVKNVKLLYDDGKNQEFLMTVIRSTGDETIRGIRYCICNKQLEIFQPVPPPGVNRMSGKWYFSKTETNSTKVIAERNFSLIDQKDEAYFSSKLELLLEKNLGLFKNALEQTNIKNKA